MKDSNLIRLFFCFLICSTTIVQTQCTTHRNVYYISKAGDDANPGTRSKPFKTIQKIAGIKLNPGDKICLKGEEVFAGTLSLTANGTRDEPILMTSYENEKGNATIHGGSGEAIILRGSHFQLKDINVKGAGRKTGSTASGITLLETADALVENVIVEGFQKSGIEVKSCRSIDIKNVYAINNGFCGVHITGSKENRSKNIRVRDCKAENNAGDPTALDNHSGNGILAGWSDSVLIDHCTATNNGWDMPRTGNGPVGIWAYECNYVTIQYCISYRNKTSKGGKDGGGFDLDGGVTNSVIQYCLSYENEGAGYGLFQYWGASLWFNDTIRYCVSINDATTTEGSGGIFVWNGANDSVQLADCVVHNNVVYSTHAPAIQFEQMSLNKNFLFLNNIFLGEGPVVHGPKSGEKFIGNVWWTAGRGITFRGYENLADWSAATGQERLDGQVAGKQIDPELKGPFTTTITDPYQLHLLTGYTLSPQSPLKDLHLDAGTFKIPLASRDFFGAAVSEFGNPGICQFDRK